MAGDAAAGEARGVRAAPAAPAFRRPAAARGAGPRAGDPSARAAAGRAAVQSGRALRQEMAREIRILQQRGGITTIMVTHDQTEAMALADRLVVMHDGRVQQIGTPEQVHSRPANPFVARFIGGSNIVHRSAGRRPACAARRHRASRWPNRYTREGEATLAVRPDSVRLAVCRAAMAASRARSSCAPGWARWWNTRCASARRSRCWRAARAWPRCGAAPHCRHTRGAALGGGGRTAVRCGRPCGCSDGIIRETKSCVNLTLSRRGVLGGAALLAAPAIIRPARAAEQCVVGTWGGDYARLLRENIDDPILKPAGVEVVQDIGDETPRDVQDVRAEEAAARHDGHRLSRRIERLSGQRRRPGRGARRKDRCRI